MGAGMSMLQEWGRRGLCSSKQCKGVSVVPLQSRIETSDWSWHWAVAVGAHGSCGSSARVMLRAGCCWLLTETDLSCSHGQLVLLFLRWVKHWGSGDESSSDKGRAASQSCSSQSPPEHCREGVRGVQTSPLMGCEGWRGVQHWVPYWTFSMCFALCVSCLLIFLHRVSW